jgi:hypothetical protein
MSETFQLRSAAIVSEIIDGEAIILDLRSGLYFSAAGSAAIIWDGLAAGFPVAAVEARLATCYEAPPDGFYEAILTMLAALTSQGLLEPTIQPAPQPAGSTPIPPEKSAFTPPALNPYGDLQDLALLDPIHDVEAEGWPNRRSELPLA